MLIFISVGLSTSEMLIAGFKNHHTGPKPLTHPLKTTH